MWRQGYPVASRPVGAGHRSSKMDVLRWCKEVAIAAATKILRCGAEFSEFALIIGVGDALWARAQTGRLLVVAAQKSADWMTFISQTSEQGCNSRPYAPEERISADANLADGNP
jgi:hypothetical protein